MFIYEDNDQLKKELKKLVIDSGMTQKEVAEKNGSKTTTIYKYCK